MSMLAEPRRRVKYSTDPRGLNWSKDEDKFGQKMLEKMGWSKGKGLGAKLDGREEHVSVQLKTDARGVGCTKSQADNWIAHQDDFNSLLANLSQVNNGGNNSSDEGGKDNVISLEEKSKSSKGRVHYMKFTKGKDLSSRKGEELDCIFGRRKSKSAPTTPQTMSQANSDTENDKPDRNEPAKAKLHGVVTVTNTLSVSDYFAKKMSEIKAKMAQNRQNANSENKVEKDDSDSSDHNERVGFGLRKSETEPVNLSQFSRRSEEFGIVKNENVDENLVHSDNEEIAPKKKKKKNKKRKDRETENEAKEGVVFTVGETGNTEESEPPKKKKKKVKKNIQDGEEKCNTEVEMQELGGNVEEKPQQIVVTKKIKKKKVKKVSEQANVESAVVETAPKTKKKKVKKNTDEATNTNESVAFKQEDGSNQAQVSASQDETTSEPKKKRKSKKQTKAIISDIVETKDDDLKTQQTDIEIKSVQKNTKTLKTKSTKAEKLKKKKKKKKLQDKLAEQNGYIKIDPNRLNDKRVLKKVKEVGFSGSNLGEVVGYGGGVDLDKKQKKLK